MAKHSRRTKGKRVARSTIALRAFAWALSEWAKQFSTPDSRLSFPTPRDRRELELRLTALAMMVDKHLSKLSETDVAAVDLVFVLTLGYRMREVWQDARRKSAHVNGPPILLRAHNLELLPNSAIELNRALRILSADAFNGQLDGDPEAKKLLYGVMERRARQFAPVYERILPPDKDLKWDDLDPRLLHKLGSAIRATEARVAAKMKNLASRGSAAPYLFHLEAHVWVLIFDGHTVQVPQREAKGLAYIQQLLMRPGETIDVVTLAEQVDHDVRVRAASSAGEVMDDEARLAVRRRYNAATEERDKAKRNNDRGRIEKLDHEIAAIADEVRRAERLGGRSRFAKDQVDRLRSSQSNAITRAIQKLRKYKHKRLATHLEKAIKRGRYMSYTPESQIDWEF